MCEIRMNVLNPSSLNQSVTLSQEWGRAIANSKAVNRSTLGYLGVNHFYIRAQVAQNMLEQYQWSVELKKPTYTKENNLMKVY